MILKKKRFVDGKVMPWKNGQGTTSELAIYPEGSQLDRGDFIWRVSTARIEADNSFSQFPGYDRKLAILRGDGLELNEVWLGPNQVESFAGEDKILCKLKGPMVEDFGIIFKRGFCQCDMIIQCVDESINWELGKGTHFLLPLDGGIEYGQDSLSFGEFLYIKDIKSLSIRPFQKSSTQVLLLSII